MFRITAETCRAFTLAEILIMAAINNMETTPSPSVKEDGEMGIQS